MLNSSNYFDFCNTLGEIIGKVVFVYDVELNQFSYLNPAFEHIFGISRNVLTQPGTLQEIIHEEDIPYVIDLYKQLLDTTHKKEGEFRIVYQEKAVRWLKAECFLMQDGNRKIITGIIEDVTKFKELFDLEQKFSAKKNAILQILSHDLAGPLNNIQSLSSLISTRLTTHNDEELLHVVGLITQQSKSGIKLIKDFVEQEFLESVQMELIKQRVNIVERLQEVVEQFQETQQTTKKSFELTSSDPSIYVEIDQVKFLQAILILSRMQ